MLDTRFFLDNLWRWKCGLAENESPLKPSLEDLRGSEWSVEFERLMRNRLVMGAIRYGALHAENKPRYDRVSSIIARAKKYEETHNKELLVDIANLSLLEFEEGEHPDNHFKATDDKEHVEHYN